MTACSRFFGPEDDRVHEVAERLHKAGRADVLSLSAHLPRLAYGWLRGRSFAQTLEPHDLERVGMSVPRDEAQFLYITARAVGATRVLEYGSSFGLSTLYLAAAVRDNGGGLVVGTEIEPTKRDQAEANLREAGLADYADVRLGDASKAFSDEHDPVDLLFLDGWPDLYRPLLRLLAPRLAAGSVVLAGNYRVFRKALATYAAAVVGPGNSFASTLVPIGDGVLTSVFQGHSVDCNENALSVRLTETRWEAPMSSHDHEQVSLSSGFLATMCVVTAAALLACSTASPPPAFQLAITNSQIVDGTGNYIGTGSVLVQDGRIVAVDTDEGDGPKPAVAECTLDARGQTLMPGFIDAHVHLLVNFSLDSEQALERHIREVLPDQLLGYLAEGFTTLMSTGDYWPGIGQVRDAIDSGELIGPRIKTVGPIFTVENGMPTILICRNPWCKEALAVELEIGRQPAEQLDTLRMQGVETVKLIYEGEIGAQLPAPLAASTIELAHKSGMEIVAYTPTAEQTRELVSMGVDSFVMPAHEGLVTMEVAQTMRDTGVSSATVAGVYAPIRDERGRERSTFHQAYSEADRDKMRGIARNIRRLLDSGVNVAFGTDTPAIPPSLSKEVELRALEGVPLSPAELVRALTLGAAIHIGVQDKLGTIEVGKFADLVLLGGDPLANTESLREVKHVIKEGRVLHSLAPSEWSCPVDNIGASRRTRP